MDSNLKYATTQLARGRYLRLDDVAGRSVAMFEGMVWITQDGDLRDYFVGEGQTWRIERPGVVLIEAIDDARLIVFEPRTAGAGHEPAGPPQGRIPERAARG